MKTKTTTTNTATEKNTTNTTTTVTTNNNLSKLTIQELRNFLDYAYNSLSNKKEIKKDGKEKMAIDLLTNLKKKKVILKKSEYTDTAKIILKEFPELNKFFGKEETKEDKKEVKKENNKKEEVKKETKKEVKKEEANKKEVKAEETKEEKEERAFPSGIKLERKTFRKVDTTFVDLKKKFEEGKNIIVAYYWTQQDIEVFGYNANNEHIKKPTQFRYNLDLSKVVYATDNLIYAVSLQTDAMYLLTADDFNRHLDGYLYSGGVEFEVYSSK